MNGSKSISANSPINKSFLDKLPKEILKEVTDYIPASAFFNLSQAHHVSKLLLLELASAVEEIKLDTVRLLDEECEKLLNLCRRYSYNKLILVNKVNLEKIIKVFIFENYDHSDLQLIKDNERDGYKFIWPATTFTNWLTKHLIGFEPDEEIATSLIIQDYHDFLLVMPSRIKKRFSTMLK
jgi:hypothetical protein